LSLPCYAFLTAEVHHSFFAPPAASRDPVSAAPGNEDDQRGHAILAEQSDRIGITRHGREPDSGERPRAARAQEQPHELATCRLRPPFHRGTGLAGYLLGDVPDLTRTGHAERMAPQPLHLNADLPSGCFATGGAGEPIGSGGKAEQILGRRVQAGARGTAAAPRCPARWRRARARAEGYETVRSRSPVSARSRQSGRRAGFAPTSQEGKSDHR